MESNITHIRPRFDYLISLPHDELIKKLQENIQNSPDHISGQVVDNHIILDIVGDTQHFWSPHLNFRIEEDEDEPNKSRLVGHIGPRPTVWTLFVFIYFLIFVLGMIGSIVGMSDWMLGEKNILVWSFPVAAIFMVTAYWTSKIGQKLGTEQMEQLFEFLREAIK